LSPILHQKRGFVRRSKLYKQAARLGAIAGYREIGNMYRDGEGVSQDTDTALEFYKEAVRCGDYESYREMADLFMNNGHAANAHKCWRKAIESAPRDCVGDNGFFYLSFCRNHGLAVENLDALRPIKHEMIRFANETMARGGVTPLFHQVLRDVRAL
jgi:TPR repeat protein